MVPLNDANMIIPRSFEGKWKIISNYYYPQGDYDCYEIYIDVIEYWRKYKHNYAKIKFYKEALWAITIVIVWLFERNVEFIWIV